MIKCKKLIKPNNLLVRLHCVYFKLGTTIKYSEFEEGAPI